MKVRLPLPLLFACASAVAFGVPAVAQSASSSSSSTSSSQTTPTQISPSYVYDDPIINRQWQWFPARNGVEIAELWNEGITGAGVVIGIIDTWVEPNHEDLNVSPYNPGTDPADGLSKDFIGTEELPADGSQIYTDENHGTFVAGMAAAVGGNDAGIVGAAPGATIAGLHSGSDGSGVNISAATEAAYWASGVSGSGDAVSYLGEAAIQVKNCSFGGVYTAGNSGDRAFAAAVEATSLNNVIYVFAAGNSRGDGYGGDSGWNTNASLTNAGILVAATDSDGVYADFSNYGANIFISAPGDDVVSTDRTGELGYNTGSSGSSSSTTPDDSTTSTETTPTVANDDYAAESGTSFASPLVAGVIALGKQVCPVMDSRWAKHALAYSSGHGEAPNIDAVYDEEIGSWVQKSGYTTTVTDPETGETTTTTVNSTGDWQQNNGGYWFNNNYGFGMIDPVGFVDTVRDIAYTTVETSASIDSSRISLKDSDVNPSAQAREATYVFTTGTTGGSGAFVSQIPQSLETVSVTIDFANEIDAEAGAATDITMDLNSLTVTLIAPDGQKSVLVQPAGETVMAGDSSIVGTSWTFSTNAFWGSNYATQAGEWRVEISYDGATGNEELITVSSVDFTMGGFVMEGSSGCTINADQVVNAHSLMLDDDGFVVRGGGEFYVEDTVCVNGGSFTVEEGGVVGSYADAKLKKGAAFLQYGGSTSISGSATFERGVNIYGGTFNLHSSINSGSGVNIYGGTFVVAENDNRTAVSAGTVTLNGGRLNLANNANFGSGVTVNGGAFSAGVNATGTTLSVFGGSAALSAGTSFTGIVVGQNAVQGEGEDEGTAARGGALSVLGDVDVSSGISLFGVASGSIAGGSTVTLGTFGYVENDAGENEWRHTNPGSLSAGGNAVLAIGGNTTVDGALSVADSAVVAWKGTMAVRHGVSVSGGTLYADGETTLDVTPDAERVDSGSDETEYGFVVANGGAFDVGKTTVTGDMQVEAGATLVFSSRSRGDSDTLEVKGKFDFSGYDSVHEATTSIVYDFGDAVPYGGAELVFVPQREVEVKTDSEGERTETVIKDYVYDGYVVSASGVENIVVMNEAWPTLLTVKSDGSLAEEEIVFTLQKETVQETLLSTTETNPDTGDRTTVETVLEKVVFSLETEQEISNLSLHYDGFSARQNAVSHALLRANQLGSADISPFAAEYNQLQNASELAAALDSVGVPVNLIAIDELHDKQASAVTGALSRRSRELRGGFIHADTWSNPLFGNSGFTYAARPDSDASSGFVPYLSPFEDNPLMIWMNGGFSFSEADDNEGMALSKTKSNMLNVFMGADYALSDDVAVGIFAGFTSGRTKFDDGGRTEIQSRNIGVYLAGCETDEIGSLYYTALAAFGFEEYDFSRKIFVGNGSWKSTADPDGWQGIAFIEGGYEWKMNRFSMGPALSLRYVSNNIDGYTESSSEAWARQEVDDVSYDSLQSSVGWRISYRADFDFVSLLPEVRLSWNHEFLGTDEDFDARLALPLAETYTNTINSTGDDYATAGAGLTVLLGDFTTVSFDYDIQFLRDDADPTHSFNAIFRTRF